MPWDRPDERSTGLTGPVAGPVPSPSSGSERKALLRHRGAHHNSDHGGGAHHNSDHGGGNRELPSSSTRPHGPLHRADEPDRAAGTSPSPQAVRRPASESSVASSPRGRSRTTHDSFTPRSDPRSSPSNSRLSRSVDSLESPRSRARTGEHSRSFSNSYWGLSNHYLGGDNNHPGGLFDGGTPLIQRMDRGGGPDGLGPRPALTHGFGGSEHDFLDRLSALSGDETTSSAGTSSSRGGTANARMRGRSGGESDRAPPVEITATFPPYGLPRVVGSPCSADANANAAGRDASPPASLDRGGEAFVVLGIDLTRQSRRSQFLISAGGAFGFSLLYGYLQELLSVELCHRKLGLFLACAQFAGYTALSYFFRRLDGGFSGTKEGDGTPGMSLSRRLRRTMRWGRLRGSGCGRRAGHSPSVAGHGHRGPVPTELYVGLSILRAIDLGMTNLAMQFLNYPAKTLMKSTRVLFTMLFGVVVAKKRYGIADYSIVALMVAGLALFMHADSHSSAVFQPVGIAMLTVSLLCDGAISNMSEQIMNGYSVGQDEFIYRLYGTALFFITLAAGARGDLRDGLAFLSGPGTLQEMEEGSDPTWSVSGKLLTMTLFSATGFLSSSCSAAITKSFGALAMSITSTARKAATIFLSFAIFKNECTVEHVSGIVLFVASLVAKSLRASRRGHRHHHHHGPYQYRDKRKTHQGDEAV